MHLRFAQEEIIFLTLLFYSPSLSSGPTRILPFDLSTHMGVDYSATSPNLLAAYVRVLKDESIETQACATSQAFYVIRGQGKSTSTDHNLQVVYKQGDLFVMPHAAGPTFHEGNLSSLSASLPPFPFL